MVRVERLPKGVASNSILSVAGLSQRAFNQSQTKPEPRGSGGRSFQRGGSADVNVGLLFGRHARGLQQRPDRRGRTDRATSAGSAPATRACRRRCRRRCRQRYCRTAPPTWRFSETSAFALSPKKRAFTEVNTALLDRFPSGRAMMTCLLLQRFDSNHADSICGRRGKLR